MLSGKSQNALVSLQCRQSVALLNKPGKLHRDAREWCMSLFWKLSTTGRCTRTTRQLPKWFHYWEVSLLTAAVSSGLWARAYLRYSWMSAMV